MAFCVMCGNPVKDDASFCGKCGNPIKKRVKIDATELKESVPVPAPAPKPEPVPAPKPEPVPAPAPEPKPAPEPVPRPAPAPSQKTSGGAAVPPPQKPVPTPAAASLPNKKSNTTTIIIIAIIAAIILGVAGWFLYQEYGKDFFNKDSSDAKIEDDGTNYADVNKDQNNGNSDENDDSNVVKDYNPFDYLEVVFSEGENGATVTWYYNGSYFIASDFEATREDGLARGDAVEIRLNLSEEEIERRGVQITRTSGTYICDVDVEVGADDSYDEYSDDYILPTSDREYLTEADLEGLTKEELRLARNELYARHGRLFQDEMLQSYFNSKDWYDGYIDPDDFNERMLNDYEMANKDLIVEYERKMGY